MYSFIISSKMDIFLPMGPRSDQLLWLRPPLRYPDGLERWHTVYDQQHCSTPQCIESDQSIYEHVIFKL